MPLQATSGAASYDAFGGGVPVEPVYIEQIFSTYLYTGNGSTQTITNGIDLSGKGGMVWVKNRSSAVQHFLFDTSRGMGFASQSPFLSTNLTDAQTDAGTNYIRADTTGFSYGSSASGSGVNAAPNNYASWTFRKQPKFFDVVTWTGNSSYPRNISHNLGSVPGCIIAKRTDSTGSWIVYHVSTGAGQFLELQTTGAAITASGVWDATPTSTQFTVGSSSGLNINGGTYVAYLFAHNAGGFGLTGTDNVISCGSYSGTGATGNAITLGYEAQWVMVKRTDSTADWEIMDAMRSGFLEANTSDAESGGSWFSLSGDNFFPTATGFQINTAGAAWNASGGTYIYIAIRRGPMKVPTSGTSVFDISTVSTSSGPVPGPTPTDMTLNKPSYNVSANDWRAVDRLRGGGLSLFPNTTGAESAENYVYFDYQSGLRLNSWPVATTIWYNFKRAPSFMDVVCYTGTAANRTVAHNLTVTPELIIIKNRSVSDWNWAVYSSTLTGTQGLAIDLNIAAFTTSNWWNNTNPTSSVFTVGTAANTNASGNNLVAYLFATCAGVSKVGTYTGNGTTQTINCGFTGGARFVLIKRTDSTGDWYVWDTARGIVSGNDPYLLLNSSAAEVTNTDYIDTYSAGFEISSTAPSAINASGGTFIFLAIA